MTIRQTEAYFKRKNAHVASRPERLLKLFEAQAKFHKNNPEARREFMVRAGVLTPTGRLTKPYRTMIREDVEYAAQNGTGK